MKLTRSRAFSLVFEDPDLIVVDKAAGVLTVPTQRRERFTLVDELSRYLSRGPRITRRALVVHRLDRETSGLLVFGKNPHARDRLVDGIAARKADRRYLALAAGHVVDDEGELHSRLITDQKTLTRRSAREGDDEGEAAVTRFRVLRRAGAKARGATLVELVLDTGRRNQIRVHLAELGHPLLGDDRYGPRDGAHTRWDGDRLALHAARLSFLHPRTGAPLSFESPMPPVFARYLDRLDGVDAGGRAR